MGDPTASVPEAPLLASVVAALVRPVRPLTWLEQDSPVIGVRPVEPSTILSSPGQNREDGVMDRPEVGVLIVVVPGVDAEFVVAFAASAEA